jgi:hypothetical protein
VPERRERSFSRGTDPQISTNHDRQRSASAGAKAFPEPLESGKETSLARRV